MSRKLLLQVLLLLAHPNNVISPAAGQSAAAERTCGLAVAGPSVWIDVPTFWINLDSAAERAGRMRAQLSATLAPGTCATRVSAVTRARIGRVARGSFLFRNESTSELRFEQSPSTHPLEIAVMLSHLKALHMARALDPSPNAAFLILEDDVDVLYFPRVRVLRPEWPTSRLSASSLRQSFPEDWSFAQLMVITLAKRWRLLYDMWEAGGQSTAVRAELLTDNRKHGCENKLWSAGAYLARGSAIAEALEIWPTRLDARGQFEANVSRTCWHFRTLTMLARCSPPFELAAMLPNLVSDQCLLHYESFGPALSEAQAHPYTLRTRGGTTGVPTGKDLIRLKLRLRPRTYAVTPPFVPSQRLDHDDMAHPEDFMVHSRSMALLRGWWETGSVPDVLDDGVWWWSPPNQTSPVAARAEPPAAGLRVTAALLASGRATALVQKYQPPRKPGKIVKMFAPPARSPTRVAAESKAGGAARGGGAAAAVAHVGRLELRNVRAVLGSRAESCTARDWRFGLPELQRGLLASSPYVCAERSGCRAPLVLGHGNWTQLKGLALGRHGEAFNPAIAHLLPPEAEALHRPAARYVATVRHGSGQQCSDEEVQPDEEGSLSRISVLLLSAQLEVLASARLEVKEPNCVGAHAIMEDCRLFRYAPPAAAASAGSAGAPPQPLVPGVSLWLHCVCHSFAFSRKERTILINSPFVSPLMLTATAGGALTASLPAGLGGFLYANPGGHSAHLRGGDGQRNQLLFQLGGELYVHWQLSPVSALGWLPAVGEPAHFLAQSGMGRGELCCAQPLPLEPSREEIAVSRLELGEARELLHLSAGLVHLPRHALLLGVAHAHRDLWARTAPADAGVLGHLPAYGTHYTHLFYALSDKPPFALARLGTEFCLPRIRPGVTIASRATAERDAGDCNLIQFVTSILLEGPESTGAALPVEGDPGRAQLLLAYGVDDCGAAVVRFDLETTLGAMRSISHWHANASA